MIEKGNDVARQLNSYFSSHVDMLMILKSLIDLDCDLDGVLDIDSELSSFLKCIQYQDISRLKDADSRIPFFKLACRLSDLQTAIKSVSPNEATPGSIDHVFNAEV